jgi:hypothetical protein
VIDLESVVVNGRRYAIKTDPKRGTLVLPNHLDNVRDRGEILVRLCRRNKRTRKAGRKRPVFDGVWSFSTRAAYGATL